MLSTLIAVSLQVERDAHRDGAQLRDRDRTLGRSLSRHARRPARLLRAWVDQVLSDDDRTTVQRATTALHGTGALLLVLGAMLGAGAAAAVYSYDGSRPINILPALATFVVLPLLLLLPLLVQLLPLGLPGWNALRDALAAFGAAMLGLLLRVLGQHHRERVQVALGRGRAHQRVFAPLQKWVLLGWSQGFAVAFHVGAIAWLLGRVLVTDLSFTWSTTAEFVTPERVHTVMEALSTPWAAWLPSAVPSIDDVRATQYFRLGEGVVAVAGDPSRLGRWWSFLLLCMVSYGLAPRVITWALCGIVQQRTARWTLRHLPGVDDVLDRLLRTDVRTQSDEPEALPPGARATREIVPADVDATPGSNVVLVEWSQVGLTEAEERALVHAALGGTLRARLAAGAGHSLEHDDAVLDEVARGVRAAERGHAVVLVKAWEPATMEAMDFVKDLRTRIGDGVRITVLAQRLRPAGDAEDRDVAQWRRRCATLGDPWLRVLGVDPMPREER